jgi:putative flippase GtrA
MKKDRWIYNLFRHQIAGLIATSVDFGILILLTEVFDLWYVFSTAIGALLGATTNFFISSYWAFAGSINSITNQMYKYILVSAGSLALNVLFVYILTDLIHFDYKVSKIIVAITIAWTYNFLLMRYYVFKK